jgi:hypothetical protein
MTGPRNAEAAPQWLPPFGWEGNYGIAMTIQATVANNGKSSRINCRDDQMLCRGHDSSLVAIGRWRWRFSDTALLTEAQRRYRAA